MHDGDREPEGVKDGVRDVDGVGERVDVALTLAVAVCEEEVDAVAVCVAVIEVLGVRDVVTDTDPVLVMVSEPVGVVDTGMHADAPVVGVYVPALHTRQVLAPVLGAYCPILGDRCVVRRWVALGVGDGSGG